MIETITWPTAAINGDNPEQINYNAVEIYSRERGTYTGKQCSSVNKCNDTIERTTSWTGKVGLMLPSDYVYAVGGSVRSTCLQKDGYDYDVDCKDYDWLYYFVTQWTMVPAANAVYPSYIYYVRDSGKLMAIEGETGLSRNVYAVRPVVALKSNIEIKDYVVSDGSYNNPYQIKIY